MIVDTIMLHCMDSPVYMLRLFLYSCCIDHCSYYMDYCYLNILILLLYEYFRNTATWIFPVSLIFVLNYYYLDITTTDLICVKLSVTWDKVSHHIRGGGHLLNSEVATSRIPTSFGSYTSCLMLYCYTLLLLFPYS